MTLKQVKKQVDKYYKTKEMNLKKVEKLEQLLEKLVKKTAKALIKENGITTNLDIKNVIRNASEFIPCTQKMVSKIMNKFHEEQIIEGLDFNDNGTFREYFVMKTSKLNRTDLAGKLRKKGKKEIVIVEFTTKSGEFRRYMGNTTKRFMDNMGYIEFYTETGEYERIDPKKLICFITQYKKYTLK